MAPNPALPDRPLGPDAHIVIVGGGFSGALLAANLVRFGGQRCTIIERAPERLGRGVAYSAVHPSQLLNVRAAGMSAYPDDPGHFARWLADRGVAASKFVARGTYGLYLSDTLACAQTIAGERLSVIHASVVAIENDRDAVLDDGRRIAADAIVLTLGNLPPHAPAGIDADSLSQDLYIGDPWASNPAVRLTDSDRVLLIGTGLTAIDVALKLDAAGFAGEIVALSRRGLSPRRHIDGAAPPTGLSEPPGGSLSAMVRSLRAAAVIEGWRPAIDALRPVTQRWWARADEATQRRFLRHLRPYWDVHRHRLAPAVADRIDGMVAAGRLSFVAGKVAAVDGGEPAAVSWRPRGQDAMQTMRVRRIINCTGPQGDLARSHDPLLNTLRDAGIVRADPLALGIDVDARSRVIDADGRAQPHLHCIGPMTRGSFWEIVAVPDIRRQCADLARRLSNAHWVAEGL